VLVLHAISLVMGFWNISDKMKQYVEKGSTYCEAGDVAEGCIRE